jgi:uncharacterized protein YcbK (DUF882 family)
LTSTLKGKLLKKFSLENPFQNFLFREAVGHADSGFACFQGGNFMSEKISPHFARSEFACRCGCGFDRVAPELVYVLECVREHFGRPVRINSACRCERRNRVENGKQGSQHLYGRAADIAVEGVPAAEVADFCESLIGDRGGVGRYAAFTHADVRGVRARWKG